MFELVTLVRLFFLTCSFEQYVDTEVVTSQVKLSYLLSIFCVLSARVGTPEWLCTCSVQIQQKYLSTVCLKRYCDITCFIFKQSQLQVNKCQPHFPLFSLFTTEQQIKSAEKEFCPTKYMKCSIASWFSTFRHNLLREQELDSCSCLVSTLFPAGMFSMSVTSKLSAPQVTYQLPHL